MKADNAHTGHNRYIHITEIDGALNGYLDDLRIEIKYINPPNDGDMVLKACTLDRLVIPAIIAALNASHQPRKVYSYVHCGNWDEFIAAKNSRKVVEINVDMYHYWLGVLPPRRFAHTVLLPFGKQQAVDFTTGEGEEASTAFWQEGDRYFCCTL